MGKGRLSAGHVSSRPAGARCLNVARAQKRAYLLSQGAHNIKAHRLDVGVKVDVAAAWQAACIVEVEAIASLDGKAGSRRSIRRWGGGGRRAL